MHTGWGTNPRLPDTRARGCQATLSRNIPQAARNRALLGAMSNAIGALPYSRTYFVTLGSRHADLIPGSAVDGCQ